MVQGCPRTGIEFRLSFPIITPLLFEELQVRTIYLFDTLMVSNVPQKVWKIINI